MACPVMARLVMTCNVPDSPPSGVTESPMFIGPMAFHGVCVAGGGGVGGSGGGGGGGGGGATRQSAAPVQVRFS